MGLADKCQVFIAPKIMGDVHGLGSFSKLAVKHPARCYGFKVDMIQRVGEDVMLTVYPRSR
jgi:riboflavin biosynthesis pyrimidine reductase